MTLPFATLQIPVLAVDGDTPSWWLWDSHVASPIEKRSSSWSSVERVVHEGRAAWRLGTLIAGL